MSGQILSVSVRSDGESVDVVFSGMSAGGVYSLGSVSAATPTDDAPTAYLLVTSPGYGYDGGAKSRERRIALTRRSLTADVRGTVVDEVVIGSDLRVRFQLAETVGAGDSVQAFFASGVYTAASVPSSAFAGAATNSSASPQVSPIASWSWGSTPAF